jgi:hypothetical protein
MVAGGQFRNFTTVTSTTSPNDQNRPPRFPTCGNPKIKDAAKYWVKGMGIAADNEKNEGLREGLALPSQIAWI